MADLNETSLEDADDISTFTDDRGLTISVQATKLVIPPQLVFVDRILIHRRDQELLTMMSTQSRTRAFFPVVTL